MFWLAAEIIGAIIGFLVTVNLGALAVVMLDERSRKSRYKRCLSNIYRLECELGFREARPRIRRQVPDALVALGKSSYGQPQIFAPPGALRPDTISALIAQQLLAQQQSQLSQNVAIQRLIAKYSDRGLPPAP